MAAVFGYQRRMARTAATGSVTVETAPVGLPVSMGGKSLGITPLTTWSRLATTNCKSAPRRTCAVSRSMSLPGLPSFNGWNSPTRCRPSARTLEGCACRPSLTHLPVLVDGAAARTIAGGARQSRTRRSRDRGPHQRRLRQACGVDTAPRNALVDRVLRGAGERSALSPPGG